MSVTLDNITYPECPPQPPPVSIGYAIFSQFVNGFLTSICVAVGTVGNFYSVRSIKLSNFDKNSNRGVTLAFSIVTLAIWDSILLWFAFFYYGFKNLVHAEYLSFVNIFTPYMHGCSQVANTASIWCVVAITVQRYWATRDPFRTTRWLLHITSAELKEYAPIRSSLRHHRALINSFRGDRRKSSSFYFCTMYRKQLAMPLALSFLAIFVNIPAFFEVTTITCYRILTKRVVYVLKISGMRLSPIYTLWYKVVFRMLITTCGPNICILLLTIRTVMLLRGSTKSRRHLFQMSDSLIDRYSSKATMLTMISIMLVVKFLAFRSLSFMLDIWELLFGFGENIRVFVYLVDLSNIMILLNSSTNCFIIFWCSKWLQEKIVQRNTLKREKLICGEGNWFASMDRINLLHKSWRQLVSHTHDQVGQRVLYAMLIGNPQVFSMFRQICKSSETGTPVQCNRNKRVVRLTSSARMTTSPSMDWDPLGRLHPESISISATVNETIDDRYRHSPKPVQIVVPIMKQDEGEVFASAEDLLNIPSTSSEGENTVRFLLDAETVRQTASPRPSSPASTTSTSSKSHNHHKKMKKSNSAVPVESQVKYYSCPMTDEERKEKPVEILMNRQFNKISEQITTFIDDTIQDMRKGTSEAEVSQSIRKLGDLHYEKGILIPPTAWRDFKQSIFKGLEECSYNNEHERRLVMETWNSFIAMFIREMKLSMLGASNNGTQPNVHHKFSTVSQCGNFERR